MCNHEFRTLDIQYKLNLLIFSLITYNGGNEMANKFIEWDWCNFMINIQRHHYTEEIYICKVAEPIMSQCPLCRIDREKFARGQENICSVSVLLWMGIYLSETISFVSTYFIIFIDDKIDNPRINSKFGTT